MCNRAIFSCTLLVRLSSREELVMTFGFKSKESNSNKKTAKSESILCDAITKKTCVTASYKGGPIHLLEPYALYHGSENNELVLSAVRVDGPSGHSNHEMLEVFEVAQLSFLELAHQTFTPDPRFNSNDPKYQDKVVCAV